MREKKIDEGKVWGPRNWVREEGHGARCLICVEFRKEAWALPEVWSSARWLAGGGYSVDEGQSAE